MTISTLGSFDRRSTAFWATTYTFEPGLFDEFIFRRIGEPPLNANILVDASRIEALWDDWQAEPWRLGRINRDYLVRPVHFPAAAFHPKTYLLAGKNSATLLVGSGNLGINGMLEGKEVFSEFSSTTEEGAAAIAAWYGWMGHLISRQGDDALRERWIRFVNSATWLPKNPTGTSFIHNLERSIHEQLVEATPRPVDELHVFSPFYDAKCTALAHLIHALKPERLHLYLPHDVSVDGTNLANVLSASGSDVHIHGFSEEEFVHAKLFGCVSGNEAVLLSGSANCSRPALLTTADHGNAEVGVLTLTTPDVVRDAFLPAGWNLVSLDVDSLNGLTLRRQEKTSGSWQMRLEAARLEKDGHVSVRYESPDSGTAVAIAIDARTYTLAANRTADRLDPDLSPAFAWIVDNEGEQVSNSVPVDHTEQLATWLQDRSQPNQRPGELYASDVDTEIGKMLDKLSREFIFDIDEVLDTAGRGSTGAEAEEANEDTVSQFWDDFDPETLRFDPRSHRYAHLLAGHGSVNWGSDDDIVELLESMAGRFLGEETQLHGFAGKQLHPEPRLPTNPSLQRRIGNLLLRWSKALNDQRFRWINPAAPAVNYHLLLDALATSRAGRFVTPARAGTITLALLQSFLGSEKRPGYILNLPEDERDEVLSRLSPHDAQVASALIYAALDPSSKWREVVFEWQPVIRAAIEHGLLAAGEQTLAVLEAFSNADSAHLKQVPLSRVDDHLEDLAVFINDAQWCKLQEDELGFDDVTIRMNHGSMSGKWPYTVKVAGVTTLRIDPRIVTLVLRTLFYKNTPGVIIEAAEPMSDSGIPQRLNVNVTNAPSIFAAERDGEYIYEALLTTSQLRTLEDNQSGFVEILVADVL